MCIKRYRMIAFCGLIAGIMLLAIIFLSDTAVVTDTRGGTDVDGMKQIAFIISHPAEFMKTMGDFLINDYLNPKNADKVISYVGYYNKIDAAFKGTEILSVLLLVLAITDFRYSDNKDIKKGRYFAIRVLTGISVMLSVCCIAGTMYIAFNKVGADTIAGCQGRYLAPLLFAGLSTFHIRHKHFKAEQFLYLLAVILITLYVLYSGIFNVIIQANSKI